MNYQEIYSQLSLTSPPNTTEVGSTTTVTRKIRIYPSEDLKKHLEYYFGATRYVYNKAIDFINKRSKEHYEAKKLIKEQLANAQKNSEEYDKLKADEKDLKLGINNSRVRSESVTTNKDIKAGSSEEWLLNVQYLSRTDAADEALKNFRTAMDRVKVGAITHFDLKFRSKKKPKQTCYICHRALKLEQRILFADHHHNNKESRIKAGKKDMTFKVKRKGKRDYEKYKVSSAHDLKLSVDNDHYYLHVIMDVPAPVKSCDKMKDVVSLDPGGNTFQNGYSPDNRYYRIGDRFVDSLHKKYLNKIDKLQSELSKTPNKKLQSILNSLRTKVRNKVDDLHKQTASYLLKRYRVVVVGDLNLNGRCVRKENRNIPKKVARALNVLAHGKFRDYLKYRASLTSGRIVIIQNEAYTSKTCGACGHIHKDLGTSKVFRCPNCPYVADRDVHGARNILLKSLTKNRNG